MSLNICQLLTLLTYPALFPRQNHYPQNHGRCISEKNSRRRPLNERLRHRLPLILPELFAHSGERCGWKELCGAQWYGSYRRGKSTENAGR